MEYSPVSERLSPIGPKILDRTTLKPSPKTVVPQESDTPQDLLALSADQAPTRSEEETVLGETPAPSAEQANVSNPGTLSAAAETTPLAVAGASGPTLAQVAKEVASGVPGVAKSRRPLPKREASPTKKLGLFRRLGQAFLRFVGGSSVAKLKSEQEKINELEAGVSHLKTPAQFRQKTEEFRKKIEAGVPLEKIRNEAYAVARQAAFVKTGMRPYDVQVMGALAMDDGHIAEMRTGEGKTLTAILPLYLNALAGKGAHLVTVNDTLAQRDRDNMGPVFEMLGLSCECVLEDMSKEEKRRGYQADITYTTDRTLGFDYLRDRTAKRPGSKVQREPYFALIDEVDEVLIDEARTPLIISGLAQPASADFQVFNEIVRDLIPGDDFYVDPEANAVWLTETGNVWVENELALRELEAAAETASGPKQEALSAQIRHRKELGKAVRAEQLAYRPVREMEEDKPGFLQRLAGADFDKEGLEALKAGHSRVQAERVEKEEKATPYSLYAKENLHRTRYLNAALIAHHTLVKDQDYIVTEDGVHIVDENKGRTSEGRRYNDGIHQALEAKEGKPVGEEQRTVATITYPNLFKKYPRLAGMSGTAKTSEHEFVELYDLSVVSIPTNEPVIREDLGDILFPTLQDKYAAVAKDAASDFFSGKPVLVGTLSVEHNRYMAQALRDAGVPPEAIQVLNAESVRGDKKAENDIISGAGRSGVITVATNMAGRGANIKPDLVNFQQLSLDLYTAAETGQSSVVELSNLKEAEWLSQWVPDLNPVVVPGESESDPVRVRLGDGKTPRMFQGSDYPTEGLTVYGTARGDSPRIDNQLIGRAGRQGDPGASRFYLSLEDDLFTHLSLDEREALADRMRAGEGYLDGKVVTKTVEHAQGITESNAYSAREKTTKSDEVLNHQREAYFGFRDDLLTSGPDIRKHFGDLVGDSINDVMADRLPDKKSFNYGEIRSAAIEAAKELNIPMGLPFLDPALGHPDDTKMKAKVLEDEVQAYADSLTGWTLDRMKFTTENVDEALRKELLAIADVSWSEHLESMDTLEQSVQWQTLAQRDPEVEFQLQGFDVFKDTLGTLRHRATGIFLPHLVASARHIDQQLTARQE